jgi:hypothetical protein
MARGHLTRRPVRRSPLADGLADGWKEPETERDDAAIFGGDAAHEPERIAGVAGKWPSTGTAPGGDPIRGGNATRIP